MKAIYSFTFFALAILLTACGSEDDPGTMVQSNKCNSGQQATLTLDITGVGSYTFEESADAVSHATDTEGSGVDALSMFIRFTESSSGDGILFDVTIENETINLGTFNYNASSFNGSVNFYIYNGGVNGTQQDHYTFSNWTTTITELDEYASSSDGGFDVTRYEHVEATTTGTLTLVGAGTTHAFTATYTICPKY